MSFPRAGAATASSAAAASAGATTTTGAVANTSYKAVTESADAVLKVGIVLGIPLSTTSARNGTRASESNVENIILIMAVVTVDAVTKAGSGESNGGLANHREVAIIAIGISPDAINLNKIALVEEFIASSCNQGSEKTHQLIVANNSHNRERLDANALRIKGLPARFATIVTKDDIWLSVGIEILLTGAVARDSILEGGDGLSIRRVATAAVVSRASLNTVTVDIHVG